MADERLTDGLRIGQLLASEITGNEGRLRALALTDADPDVEPTPDGALAYRVVRGGEGKVESDSERSEVESDSERSEVESDSERSEVESDDEGNEGERDDDDARLVAEVHVQPDRLRIEFVAGPGERGDERDLPAIAADAAGDAGLRVRPKAVRPPRTLVFVEDGAQVKRALSVFEAVGDATETDE